MRKAVLAAVAAAAVLAAVLHAPIPQDEAYHRFADARPLAGVPNFGDVASNLPFLFVGVYGLSRMRRLKEPACARAYATLCAGVILVSFGSAYYHYAPSTPALFWDRLPMTIAFMALFSLLIEERVVESRRTLLPLLAAGAGAAAYWHWTQSRGAGDLRPYGLVQFLPIALMPLILALFPGKYLSGRRLMWGFGFYAGAKFCESFDRRIFEALGLMSGHTIKHLLAAAATLCIIAAVSTSAETRISK